MCLIRSQIGFSLIELAVVVVILGLVIAFAMPQFAGFADRTKLDNEVRKWVAYARYARSQAVLQGVQYRFYCDLDQQQYWLTYQDYSDVNKSMEIRPMDYWGKTETIDPSVQLISIQINQERIHESGLVVIPLTTRGRTSDAIITFRNQNGEKREIQLNAITGQAKIVSEIQQGY